MNFENQYLTYDEYLSLEGTLSQMPFNKLEYEAEKYVDSKTCSRFRSISQYPMELKMCIFELIPFVDKSKDCNISSESVGDYSVQKKSVKELEEDKLNIVKQYLSETKVNGIYAMYQGADVNEI